MSIYETHNKTKEFNSNAIQTIDNEIYQLINYCLNCIQHMKSSTFVPALKNEWSMGYRPLKYNVVIGRVDVIMCKFVLSALLIYFRNKREIFDKFLTHMENKL